jgi:hypothetical protein
MGAGKCVTSIRSGGRGTCRTSRSRYVASAIVIVSLLAACRSQPRGQRLIPDETTTHVVDGATITITYGRPSKRARAIFGALLPFDNVSMPGADEATILQTSAGLQFGDVSVSAGSYSFYTIPSAATWKLIINNQPDSGTRSTTRIETLGGSTCVSNSCRSRSNV